MGVRSRLVGAVIASLILLAIPGGTISRDEIVAPPVPVVTLPTPDTLVVPTPAVTRVEMEPAPLGGRAVVSLGHHTAGGFASSSLGLVSPEAGLLEILDGIDPACSTVYCDIRLSPDGTTLAYYDPNGYLAALNLRSRSVKLLAEGGAEGDRYIAWAPDSTRLAFVRNRDLFEISLATGSGERLLIGHATRVYHVLDGGAIVRALQIVAPLWTPDWELFYGDFSAPDIASDRALAGYMATYRLVPDDVAPSRVLLWPNSIPAHPAPDGRAFTLRDVRTAAGGEVAMTLTPEGKFAPEAAIAGDVVAWSQDGTRIAYANQMAAGTMGLAGPSSIINVYRLAGVTEVDHTAAVEPGSVSDSSMGFEPSSGVEQSLAVPGTVDSLLWNATGESLLFSAGSTLGEIDLLAGAAMTFFAHPQGNAIRLVAWSEP